MLKTMYVFLSCYRNNINIENNIASDICLSRNVVNKESKRSRRFVCYCDTSSGDKNYCKQGSFILYGRTLAYNSFYHLTKYRSSIQNVVIF